MSLELDWWQLGWAVAGFFLLMFFVMVFATRGQGKKMQEYGHEQGWHERQHWESDSVVKGKLERQ